MNRINPMNTIIMPNTGLTNTEGTVLQWFKSDGDVVEKGEPVVEIATDKVTTQLEAPQSGVLHIVHPDGAVVPIAEVIGYVLAPGEELPDAGAGADASAGAEAAKAPAAESAGAVGASAAEEASGAGPEGAGQPGAGARRVKASPAAKRVARELGLSEDDLARCRGTGPDGRITEEDVRRFAEERERAKGADGAEHAQSAIGRAAEAGAEAGVARTGAAGAGAGEDAPEVIPLAGIRGIIAERMVRSMREAPQFHVETEILMDRLVKMRRRCEERRHQGEDVLKPSFTEMMVMGVARALQDFPVLNSLVGPEEFTLEKHINIGVAVGADAGLVVPVVRDADRMTLPQLSQALRRLVDKARRGALEPEDLVGGTFTFSNLGMFGIDRFAAIINPPQAAILTVGRVRQVWMPVEGGGAFRPVAALTLTVDHRAIDGALAAKFMGRLAQVLEGSEIEELCSF